MYPRSHGKGGRLAALLEHLLVGRPYSAALTVLLSALCATSIKPFASNCLASLVLSVVATAFPAYAAAWLAKVAVIDSTTGLRNRFAFDIAERRRGHVKPAAPFALILLDINKFKQLNDTYGHAAGDLVLEIAANAVRKYDMAYRIGGDELAIVLRGASALTCYDIAKRVRQAFADHPCPFGPKSLSSGVAVAPQDGISFDALFAAADRDLYEQKRMG
jgi:diguanylate cyclase (GGDEF)-like protein